MNAVQPEQTGHRVLVCAPVGRDTAIIASALAKEGIDSLDCASIEQLCGEIERGAGALVVALESLTRENIDLLSASLSAQPQWSDLGLVLLIHKNMSSVATEEVLRRLGPVGIATVLERPLHVYALISSVRMALRARTRQYQVRDYLADLHALQDERDRLLESERSARAMAERHNRLKDDFVATLSHELRTPLSAMLGWLQMLRDGRVAPADREMALEVIDRNAHAQNQLILDLLDVSRIASGNLRLDVRRTDLVAVIEAAIDIVRPAAQAKGLVIEKALDASVRSVMGDPDRLQQVVWNLLSNAVKFTTAGHVIVTLEERDGRAEIGVRDTGSGIRPEFMPHMFERFRQEDGSITRSHGGLGLGLSIARQLVELHGGTIRAESPGEGSGATFTVALPLGVAAPAWVPHASRSGVHELDSNSKMPSISGIRVFVVDDDEDTRDLLQRTLEVLGASTRALESAAEALPAIEAEVPDVLLCDISMPGEDGYSLLRKVRALPGPAGAVPAIAVTAFARPEDQERALNSGFQAHVAKPFTSGALVTVIARLLRTNGKAGTAQLST